MKSLRPATGPPEIVIDLSNVCRDRRLTESARDAEWHRFELVAEALCKYLGRVPEALAIADASLRPALGRDDRREFDASVRTGLVRVAAGLADDELLEIAEAGGCLVLSLDKFRGHRRDFEFIQGNSEQFIGWRPSGGGVSIFVRDMGVAGDQTKSRFAEKDDLKGRGLDIGRTTHRHVLEERWRCKNRRCRAAVLSPDHLLAPPRVNQDGVPVCPACALPLEDAGPRPPIRKVVVLRMGEEVGRLQLEAGQVVRLDRNLLDAAFGEVPGLGDAFGSSCLELWIEGDRLLVRPIHGVIVSTGRGSGEKRELQSGQATRIERGGRVVVGDGVTLRLSGLRWPLEGLAQ